MNGGQDLPVSLRNVVAERPALHQLVIGLKHDAKLRNHFAGHVPGNVTLLLRVFFNKISAWPFCKSKEIAAILDGPRPEKNFQQNSALAPHLGDAVTLTLYSATKRATAFARFGPEKSP